MTELCCLLQLLLGPNVGGVSAGLLAAIGGPGVEPCVALAADHLVGVILLGQDAQGWLDDAAAETEHQMERGLWKIEMQKTRHENIFGKTNDF